MTQNSLQNRFDSLPPIMKWQFNVRLEKECQEKEFVNKEYLDTLVGSLKKASVIMKRFLTSEESVSSMHHYLKHFDSPQNMKKTMDILTDTLEQGDEMIFRFCYFAKQKGLPLDRNLSHPGLIQDKAEFEKWLSLMADSNLKDFNSKDSRYMAPFLEWTKTFDGQNFQKRRSNYTQAIQWYESDLVVPHETKKISLFKTLQRDS